MLSASLNKNFLSLLGCVLADLMLDLSSLIDIEVSAEVGQEAIVVGDYNVVMVCYSLTRSDQSG